MHPRNEGDKPSPLWTQGEEQPKIDKALDHVIRALGPVTGFRSLILVAWHVVRESLGLCRTEETPVDSTELRPNLRPHYVMLIMTTISTCKKTC
jgi:hypothetical protein